LDLEANYYCLLVASSRPSGCDGLVPNNPFLCLLYKIKDFCRGEREDGVEWNGWLHKNACSARPMKAPRHAALAITLSHTSKFQIFF
jgi:hypothetical protein